MCLIDAHQRYARACHISERRAASYEFERGHERHLRHGR
jgi:hypothetical protein